MSGDLLAIDWGAKKIGFAVADSQGIVVTPKEIYRRNKSSKKFRLSEHDLSKISTYINSYEVSKIILGLPLSADGSDSDSSLKIKGLAKDIESQFSVEVVLIDERLSSWEQKGTKDDDALAAASLLKDYIDQTKRSTKGSIPIKKLALFSVVFIFLFCLYHSWQSYHWFTQEAIQVPGRTLTVEIAPKSNLTDVFKELKKHKIFIPYNYFRIWAKIRSADKKLHVGEYEVNTAWPRIQVLDHFLAGKTKQYKVTIKEGANIWDIKELLKSHPKIKYRYRFIEEVRKHDFLKTIPPSSTIARSLEGYIFPETYFYKKGATVGGILKQSLALFEERALPILRQHPWGKTPEGIHKLVTLASVVEKETGVVSEQPLIASVFWNRLKIKQRLQSDPTTIYGLLPNFNGNLRKKHLLEKTPYNTYKIPALPAGPICNPGITALKAVVEPAKSDYFYFVSKNDGSHIFAKTYSEHKKNVSYYQKNAARRNRQINTARTKRRK